MSKRDDLPEIPEHIRRRYYADKTARAELAIALLWDWLWKSVICAAVVLAAGYCLGWWRP